MRIAIIDDEIDARITLRSFVEKHIPEAEIQDSHEVNAGIELINCYNPQLVFLDIQLKDGTGFDLLNAFSKRNFKVVFTTGYGQYALKAIKYSAIDYLLKPIDPEDFADMIAKIETQVDLNDLNKRLNHLESLIQIDSFQKMAFPTKEGTRFIDVKEIVNIAAEGNYTCVYTKKGEKIMVSRIIKEFEELLSPDMFFRTHKSHIVNLQYIEQFKRQVESLVLINGKEVPIARRRKEKLKLKVL